ncbi:hypothetical protein [Acidomonas methanolica]|nr:hypothetical protein [Acidomonas methanolica]MBU2653770.1 hypothetical protein [Acidomonas methanolica]TCS31723.1 hypothetical protein EDC31_102275 [Acidomonas methanolica]
MSSRAASFRTVFWPLALLALMARLGFGGVPLPHAALDDPLRRLAAIAILCDSHAAEHGHPDHPHPVDGDDGFLLIDQALAGAVPADAPAFHAARLRVPTGRIWCFPPIRGPPARRAASLYAQGPPSLT